VRGDVCVQYERRYSGDAFPRRRRHGNDAFAGPDGDPDAARHRHADRDAQHYAEPLADPDVNRPGEVLRLLVAKRAVLAYAGSAFLKRMS
jgi:hypothetical protein